MKQWSILHHSYVPCAIDVKSFLWSEAQTQPEALEKLL